MATTIFHPADKRGHADHGWLNAHHSFSFAGYYDPQKVHFGALRVLNDDIIAGGMGFGRHPHDNMEIITIALEGALAHKDSMGHEQVIYPDDVQVMSAGSGITHSEYNHDPKQPANILQTWIFPNKENVKPRYDQRNFDRAGRLNQLQTIVSPIDREDEGMKIHQDAWMYRATLEAGRSLTLKAHSADHGFYIFLIDGAVNAGGQQLGKRDAVGISDAETVDISSTAQSELLIFEVPV